ncbi:DUF4183 domain-containing protein [Alicyclobacillus acidoterrestris]|uniref:DUF4183 domain-containing protein n=1 Tax=Alicyclobacillus acidoterrestris TaxID=1450 RepID=UPI003F52E54D
MNAHTFRREGTCTNKCRHRRRSAKKKRDSHRIQAVVTLYIATAQNQKRIYTNDDGLAGYNQILSAKHCDMVSVFINGVLQPDANYTVHRNRFRLRTCDLPPAGTPIVIQFIKLCCCTAKGGD